MNHSRPPHQHTAADVRGPCAGMSLWISVYSLRQPAVMRTRVTAQKRPLICSISAETGRSPERRRTWDVSLFFHVTDHRGLNTADKESGEVHELCDVKPLWSFAPFSFRRNLRLGFHSLQLSSIRTVRLRNRDWAPIYLLRWNEYLIWLNMINPYASYPLSDTANVPFSFHWTPL